MVDSDHESSANYYTLAVHRVNNTEIFISVVNNQVYMRQDCICSVILSSWRQEIYFRFLSYAPFICPKQCAVKYVALKMYTHIPNLRS